MRGPQHEFCAKMKFPAQKNKNSSVNGTTSLAVIVGPKCLIAHLLAPHDRAFSLVFARYAPSHRREIGDGSLLSCDDGQLEDSAC